MSKEQKRRIKVNKEKECNDLSCRRNQVGGQAVIEGVMMKHGEEIALAIRKADGSVEVRKSKFVSFKSKHKWAKLPIIRGIVGFIESLVLSVKTLNDATDALDLDEYDEKEKKNKKNKKADPVVEETEENIEVSVEKAQNPDLLVEKIEENKTDEAKEKKKEGSASTIFIMLISLVLGLALALLLFNVLPTFIAGSIEKVFKISLNRYVKAVIEGVVKVIIFIVYLGSVSLMKDIRRTFQYHGAEHKSIACYEAGLELTPENARKCTRFHPRCGTSFMFVMLLLGIFVGILIPVWDNMLLRMAIRLALLPVIMGVGYEFIMYAGKHDNIFTKICAAPGLWMQRITTKEPDDYQLAIAISAIKASMAEEFPDFTPDEYKISPEENKGHIMYEKPAEPEDEK